MCGIVGVIGSDNPVEIILDGLKKLEYRGYDSAGVAVLSDSNFQTVKEEGKIVNLEDAVEKSKLNGNFNVAIGHTRWATHGSPSKENAHPHASSQICVVHNGIIENHQELKKRLEKAGAKFISQTDTEVVPHLIEYHLEKEKTIEKALVKVSEEIQGTFALAVMIKNDENVIAVAKRGSPLILGLGKGENYVASDYYALSSKTDKIVILEDDEFALVKKDGFEIFDHDLNKVKRSAKTVLAEKSKVSKDGFAHFMLKEIYEQPRVLEETISAYVDESNKAIHLPNFAFNLDEINKITIVACGTSYYAGMVAKYLIEEYVKIPVEVDIASEFRYRSHPFKKDNLMIFISQSGETADSLAALKYAKKHEQKILSIVNAPHSSMASLSDSVIRTVAGPEIGVASTKAYIAQVAILILLTIKFAESKGKITADKRKELLQELIESVSKIAAIFSEKNIKNIKKIAKSLTKAKTILYVGRGISQVTAFEAALKLRELSYINAQGIAAGELKHGSIALIDKKVPVIVLAPRNEKNELFEKTLSNAQEVNARGGKITFISDKVGNSIFGKMAKNKIELPSISGNIQEALLPVIYTQLIAYYVSLYKGNDVDQPRNLAKSVTVE